MRSRFLWLCASLFLLVTSSSTALGQDDRFTVVQQPVYLVDANGKPWGDLSDQLRVKLHSEYTKDLGADEVSVEKPPTKFSSGTWKLYPLEQDSNGTFARVNWIVLKNSTEPVVYQIGLYNPATKTEVPWLKKGASKVEMRDNTKLPVSQLQSLNPIGEVLKNNWWLIAIVLLICLVLAYLLIFRWLLIVLLDRRWDADSAQHVTWAGTALFMLLAVAVLASWLFGMRVETWSVIGVAILSLLLFGIIFIFAVRKKA